MSRGKKKKMRKNPRVVSVKSYRRKDGTRVKMHKRTRPDGIKSNNHSYRG